MTTPESDRPVNDKVGTTRRKLLGALGAGVGLAVGGAGVAAAAGSGGRAGDGHERGNGRGHPRRGPDAEQADVARTASRVGSGPDRFGRIFADLPPFDVESPEVLAALAEVGRPGGIMDAQDPLEVGPVRLITEPELSPMNRDNPHATAGSTFVGQFLDHDITRDAGSPLGRRMSVKRSVNLRTARFDLDSVYGGGPSESPNLYLQDDQPRFRVESGGIFEDLPRLEDSTAIISDPRNDENLMVSGLHAALLLFHNAVLDRVLAAGLDGAEGFDEARRIVRWHWQWLIVHEFLPAFVGQPMVDDVLARGARFYRSQPARIPVEFQAAAYRFGHSIVRPSYRANLAGDQGEPFFGFIFDADEQGRADPDDFTGGVRAARRFIGWQTFFDFGDGEVKPNKRVDTKLSTPLMNLPIFALPVERGEPIGPTSLAVRNLHRHITWELPSGQSIARTMGENELSASDLSDIGDIKSDLALSTPLWFYVLREADLIEDGLHLGPVGGRIVAEVFLELLRQDDSSYLGADPTWTPDLPGGGPTGFRMVDLLTVAGVDPDSRGQ